MSPSSDSKKDLHINNLHPITSFLIQEKNECKRTKYYLDENNNTSTEQNAYNATCPKNEHRIFTQIRKWERKMDFVTALHWYNLTFIVVFHVIATIWSIYALCVRDWPHWQTFAFGLLMGFFSGFGVTAGAHRYWCHKSYKAKKPLQLILVFCFSVAGQNSIFNWVRDHRVHHKFSETSADPHDARRGFFFSHVGWLMMRKHPAVIREGSKIDMSDITGDPLVRFHTKYFNLFKMAFCFVLPTLIPVLVWEETWEFALVSQVFLRYMLSLNFTWAVNSFAHLWGNKPYDKNIMPSENWGVSLIAFGEGWHNYHHTFPWDYKAAELAYTLNITTVFLDLFAKIGWAYDLKVTSPELIKAVMENRGAFSNKDRNKRMTKKEILTTTNPQTEVAVMRIMMILDENDENN